MIRNEDNFNSDLPAGYDGRFDWDVFKKSGCWGNTKIEPMDFDGVVERKGHYLIFETKDEGKIIPDGQRITLSNLNIAKSFTVVMLWPKSPPFTIMEVHYHTGKAETVRGHNEIIKKITSWFFWANGRIISAAPNKNSAEENQNGLETDPQLEKIWKGAKVM